MNAGEDVNQKHEEYNSWHRKKEKKAIVRTSSRVAKAYVTIAAFALPTAKAKLITVVRVNQDGTFGGYLSSSNELTYKKYITPAQYCG